MMARLARTKRDIRESNLLGAARQILLTDGYAAFTMERIATGSKCPKGTAYLHFSCKEDVILALVLQAYETCLGMMRRGAAFQGRSRERMGGVGEAVGLFSRLHFEEAQFLNQASASIREKASAHRVKTLQRVEREIIDLLRGILLEAAAKGDLTLATGITVEHMTFVFWSLVSGGTMLFQEGIPQNALGMPNPLHDLWFAYNLLADAYHWHPLFNEWDWEETHARIRRIVFTEEAQAVYGEGNWYGDAGNIHPRETGRWPEVSVYRSEHR